MENKSIFEDKSIIIKSTGRLLQIYTDGACSPNPGPGSWAFVVTVKGVIIHEECGYHPNTTNNRMEYTAFIKALTYCHPTDKVEIFSDSELLVNTYNSWMFNWAKKKFNVKKKNLDLVQQLWELKHKHPELKLTWIKGHAGHELNERADELCDLVLKKRLDLNFQDKITFF